MEKIKGIFAIAMLCLSASLSRAQEKVSCSYEYQADSAQQGTLIQLTRIHHPNTSSLRLYFEETDLGKESYLLLEGADGSTQRLDRDALKNWGNSSAYFNGDKVKISLFVAPGEKPSVKVRELQIAQISTGKNQRVRLSADKDPAQSEKPVYEFVNLEDLPHAAAVGRFTNGTDSYGTGWIAPNGSIITSWDFFTAYGFSSYDVIEFNVPESDYGTVNHPAPEDQYPLLREDAVSNFNSLSYKGPGGLSYTGYAIIEALPNSTGLRPGERQQQFFRVALNPGSFTLEASEVPANVLHYGAELGDLDNGQFKTLQLSHVFLREQNKYLSVLSDHDRDDYLLYNLEQQTGSDSGAPVVYHGTNVAIGVHSEYQNGRPSYGLGFRNDDFRNALNDFFSSDMVYVDSEGLYDSPTGEIHKPYLFVGDALQDVPDNGILNISKGTYNETLYVNQPVVFSAPVGKAVIGATGNAAGRMAGTLLPSEYFSESERSAEAADDLLVQSPFQGYPNPFQDEVQLQYRLERETPITVKVFDLIGTEVTTLFRGTQPKGNQKVSWNGRHSDGKPASHGIYIVQFELGSQVHTTKIMKK